MLKPIVIKLPRRSGHAQAARQRRAPVYKHRNESRGGARNDGRDLLAEAEADDFMDRASLYGEGW